MTATPPRPEVADRLCKGCGQTRPMRKGTRLCETCKPAKGGKKRRPPAITSTSTRVRPPGMGYNISLQVDENTGLTDVVVRQLNATAGEQAIWWNQLEAAEIRDWLTEQLGPA